nr:hypothetical protein [uncultured bacterium]
MCSKCYWHSLRDNSLPLHYASINFWLVELDTWLCIPDLRFYPNKLPANYYPQEMP